MTRAMAVTGFFPAFPAKHLSAVQCRELGDRLKAAIPGEIIAFDQDWSLERCWVHKFLLQADLEVTPSCAHPPEDRFERPQDMVISNIVLLQRYEWMRQAALLNPEVETFAWIEYTVLKQRNVTEQVIRDFMRVISARTYPAVSLPGCWPKGPINDSEAHWRFCGSCWVCPRELVDSVFACVSTVVKLRTLMTRKLSWDMNTMAYVELLDVLPIRWYAANHDETQFTNF